MFILVNFHLTTESTQARKTIKSTMKHTHTHTQS